MDKNPRICIFGAGAIGGVTAGILARENYNISLVTKYPELADKISGKGIEVSGNCGNYSFRTLFKTDHQFVYNHAWGGMWTLSGRNAGKKKSTEPVY